MGLDFWIEELFGPDIQSFDQPTLTQYAEHLILRELSMREMHPTLTHLDSVLGKPHSVLTHCNPEDYF